MKKEIVSNLVQEALDENKALFLVDLTISGNNSIKITVDGDTGIPLKECIRISRHIEHNLDREEEDFSLEVTSPDITDPLTNKRQYKKNTGRIMKIRTENKTFEGTLAEADEEKIILQWKAREPKPVGKGKVTVEKEAVIPYGDIKEAKVKVLYN